MSRVIGIGSFLLLGCATQVAAQSEGPEPVAAKEHVDNALRVAGTEFAQVANGYLCRSPKNAAEFLKPIAMDQAVIAQKAFDNLYYIGKKFVGVWALETGDGIILFDAMNTPDEAETIIAPKMRELGLDPADVRLIIVTHGHYDHFGGAPYFQEKYRTRVMMSDADWKYAADPEESAKLGIPFIAPPPRDLVAADGQVVTRGNTTIQFVITPGHTPGTISPIFTVQDNGLSRTIALWGGTAMPKTSTGLGQYHGSYHKFWNAADDAGAVSAISTHPFVDDTLGRLEKMGGGRNPFLAGAADFNRFMQVQEECILAQSARYQAWGW